MKNAILVLCLALLAGGALANLAPATPQANKLQAQASLELSEVALGPLGDPTQRASCSGLPDLGDCSQFPWGQPGVTCDCDVPVPYGTCTFLGTYTFPVTKCYGVVFCGVIADLCT